MSFKRPFCFFVLLLCITFCNGKEELFLTLDDYINQVIRNNQDLEVKSYSVKQSRALTKNQLKSDPINTKLTYDDKLSNRLSTDILDSVKIVENKTKKKFS